MIVIVFFPGRVPRVGNPGGSGSANREVPARRSGRVREVPALVREVPAMLLGVSVQVPVQRVFLKILLKGIEFSIGMQSGSFAF